MSARFNRRVTKLQADGTTFWERLICAGAYLAVHWLALYLIGLAGELVLTLARFSCFVSFVRWGKGGAISSRVSQLSAFRKVEKQRAAETKKSSGLLSTRSRDWKYIFYPMSLFRPVVREREVRCQFFAESVIFQFNRVIFWRLGNVANWNIHWHVLRLNRNKITRCSIVLIEWLWRTAFRKEATSPS